jgi:hypothetical protein
MENLYLIQSNKPTRLYEFGGIVVLNAEPISAFRNQDLYITNDEEIKEPCWCWDILQKKIYWVHDTIPEYPTICNYFKKIILTTDKDLIKDGVQSIPDEFLEWFVNNPNCNKVEVILDEDIDFDENKWIDTYHIIIPEEDTEKRVYVMEEGYLVLKEESKQETLGEDDKNTLRIEFETIIKTKTNSNVEFLLESNNNNYIKWLEAKWKSEKMYGDEDLRTAFGVGMKFMIDSKVDFKEWFNTFKKK